MSDTPSILLALAEIDPSKPTGRTDDGRPSYTVRARVPFSFSFPVLRDAVVRPGTSSAPVVDTRAMEECSSCGGSGKKKMSDGEECPECGGSGKVERAAAESAREGTSAGPKVRGPRIEGVASSTGRDCYGTEMSRTCLDGMAAQFRSGSVAYLPKHPSWSGGDGEWDDVMGYVYDGTVERGAVADSTAPDEVSYLLRVGVQLDEKHPKAASLAERIADGYPIGQSIGGWFTKLTFVWPEGTSDDEKWWSVEPDRIIVEEVELDHLAATRRPANVESWIDGVRSALASHGEVRARQSRQRDAAREYDEAARAAAAAELLAATLAEPDPEPVPEPEPQVEPEPAPLDSTPDTGHATDEPTAGSDALEAQQPAEGTTDSSTTQEPSMTEAEIQAIAERTAAIMRASSPAPAPAPAAVEDPEVVRLRAENARLQADLAAERSAPARRGHVVLDFSARGEATDAMTAQIAVLDGEVRGRRFAGVLRSSGFIARRTGVGPGVTRCETALNEDLATLPSVDSLRGDLRSICMSAAEDGLIKTPELTGWAG